MSDKYLRDDGHHFINGIGTELAWGWSPAIDFTDILMQRRKQTDAERGLLLLKNEDETNKKCAGINPEAVQMLESSSGDCAGDIDVMIAKIQQKNFCGPESWGTRDDVRVLLCGAADIRHILRTLSSLRINTSSQQGHPPPTYHFFIYEPNLRIHCRHLFFLQWLLDSMFSLDELEDRVMMFLDVLGNAMTRDTTAAQSRNVARRLLRVLQGEEGDLSKLVSFTEMKSKERDFLEKQIDHWTRDTSIARVEDTRSRRLRQEMAERYDNRDNIIDWDFNFGLHDYTNLIKFAEYRVWRNTGVAFDVAHINPRRGFTYTYSVPNKTLCHFNKNGSGLFLGDIKNGPFFALGAQTANTHIRSRTVDGTCKYGNGVVSLHNVRAWLYSLMTGLPWPWADHAFAWDDEKNYNWLPQGTPSDVAHQTTFPSVRFHFIGLDFARFLHRMQGRGGEKFDAAFVGTGCTQFMTPDFFHTAMAKDGIVIAETAKFVVDARDEAKIEFVKTIHKLASAANWELSHAITDLLHKDQPEPPKIDGGSSNGKWNKMTFDRYAMPYQIAFTFQQAT